MAAKTFATYLSELAEATALGTGDRVPILESSEVKYVDGADIVGTRGTATLVAGTATVSTTAALTGSVIFLTCNTPGGTQGILSAPVASIVNGTSFVINSSESADTSTVNWWIP